MMFGGGWALGWRAGTSCSHAFYIRSCHCPLKWPVRLTSLLKCIILLSFQHLTKAVTIWGWWWSAAALCHHLEKAIISAFRPEAVCRQHQDTHKGGRCTEKAIRSKRHLKWSATDAGKRRFNTRTDWEMWANRKVFRGKHHEEGGRSLTAAPDLIICFSA